MKSITLIRRWLQEKPVGLTAAVIIMGLPGVIYGSYLLAYRNKIYPGVKVGQVELGNRSITEARGLIEGKLEGQNPVGLRLQWQEQTWELDLAVMDLKYDADKTAREALKIGRDNKLDQWRAWFEGVSVPVEWQINEEVLVGAVATVAAQIDKPMIKPEIKLNEKELEVLRGENGWEVEKDKLMQKIYQRLDEGEPAVIDVSVREIVSTIGEAEIQATVERANKLVGDQLVLEAPENSHVLKSGELISFLDFEGGIDEIKVASYAATVAKTVDRPPQNAAFRFESGKVREFKPGKEGLKLNQTETILQMAAAIDQLQEEGVDNQKIGLMVTKTPPAVKTDQVNSFGIKELLGRGVSTFRGSILPRVHNVNLSAQRISGTLVAPGEVFSFNSVVGEVADVTGYQQAYVIRSGRTVLDDGGGVCQTSTTLFRAVMEAGLPIIERRAHSYRVGYYEQNAKPGLDATVFSPTTDFKFVNDTPAHILVQTIVNVPARTLTVEIYGTSDGRKGEVANHQVWDQAPPPPDLYQDDPSIPAGQVKQVDWSAWGAKVKFDYRVKRGGETIYEKTFYQVYQPWQAVFLRGIQ